MALRGALLALLVGLLPRLLCAQEAAPTASNTAAAAAAAAPTAAAVAGLPPPPKASPYPAVSVSTTTALVAAAASAAVGVALFLRAPVKEWTATPQGCAATAAVLVLCVWACDVAKLLPIVAKERLLGPDMLVAIVAALAVVLLQGVSLAGSGLPAAKSHHGGGAGSASARPQGEGGQGASSAGRPGADSGSGSAGGTSASSRGLLLSAGETEAETDLVIASAVASTTSVAVYRPNGSGGGGGGNSGGGGGTPSATSIVVAVADASGGGSGGSGASPQPLQPLASSLASSALASSQPDASSPSLAPPSSSALGPAAPQSLSGSGGAALKPPPSPQSQSQAAAAALLAAESDFLSLDQTLEWKGWMMSVFLLYHYWDVKLVYNLARVLVAAYLFLTGYGNFISLQGKPPTLHKFCVAFVRINALAALLMCVTRQAWMLYYICPLHTFWTAFVYLFFAVWPVANGDAGRRGLKLAAALLLLLCLYEVPGLAQLAFRPLFPLLVYRGTADEWLFRSRLDAYVPWAGMAMAHFKPQISSFLRAMGGPGAGPAAVVAAAAAAEAADASEAAAAATAHASSASASASASSGSGSSSTSTASSGGAPAGNAPVLAQSQSQQPQPQGALAGLRLPLLALPLAASLFHAYVILPLPKDVYNGSHRFTSWLAIAAFLLLRNATPLLRRASLRFLAVMGNMSLETYLLQFHVWLANNAKDLVVLFPGFRAVSFACQSALFITLAYAAASATSGLLKRIMFNARLAYGAALAIGAVIVSVNVAILYSLNGDTGGGWGAATATK